MWHICSFCTFSFRQKLDELISGCLFGVLIVLFQGRADHSGGLIVACDLSGNRRTSVIKCRLLCLLKIWCWSNKGRGTALRSFRSPCWCKSRTSLGLVPVCFDTCFHRAGPSLSWWSVCRAPTPGCCPGGCCRTMPTGGGILRGRMESARRGWTRWSEGTCPHQGRRQTETSCAATGRRVILKTTFRMERIFRWKSVLSAASVK